MELNSFVNSLLDDEEENDASVMWYQITVNDCRCRPDQGGSMKGKSANRERNFSFGHERILRDYFWTSGSLHPDTRQTGPTYSESYLKDDFDYQKPFLTTFTYVHVLFATL